MDAFNKRGDAVTDEQLVAQELNLRLADIPEGVRKLAVEMCRLSMGELLMVCEQVEKVDQKKGEMIRDIWQRRGDVARLRKALGQ